MRCVFFAEKKYPGSRMQYYSAARAWRLRLAKIRVDGTSKMYLGSYAKRFLN